MVKAYIEKLAKTHYLNKEELIYLIDNISDEEKNILFRKSLSEKEKYYGKSVYMRGLIEFSNYCKRDCNYCGIRKSNKKVQRYRLSKDEIMECCKIGYDLGYRTFVLQSGEDPYYTKDILVDLIKSIKERYEVAITLSIGERPYDEYKAFFEAGADRYLLRHETASKDLYDKIHPDMEYENRVFCLNNLKEIGFQVGAGFMVGIPGQTSSNLADDLLFLKKLEPDMIGIGPYISHSETPLAGCENGSVEDTLFMLSLTRLLLPDVLLPSTTALGTLDPLGREKALKVGANVVMPNLSPVDVRDKYELYENKICTGDEAAHCRGCIEKRINSAGFEVDMSRGDSFRFVSKKEKTNG